MIFYPVKKLFFEKFFDCGPLGELKKTFFLFSLKFSWSIGYRHCWSRISYSFCFKMLEEVKQLSKKVSFRGSPFSVLFSFGTISTLKTGLRTIKKLFWLTKSVALLESCQMRTLKKLFRYFFSSNWKKTKKIINSFLLDRYFLLLFSLHPMSYIHGSMQFFVLVSNMTSKMRKKMNKDEHHAQK